MTLGMMGRLDEASVAMTKALAALRACGADHQVAVFLSVQANIEADRGDRRQGRELDAQALVACRNLGDKFGEAIVLINLAELEFAEGHHEEALRCVNDALEILSRSKNAFNLAIAQSNKAAYCIALGGFTEARESARDGLRFAQEAQNEGLVVNALEQFAMLAANGDNMQSAARLRGYVDAQNRRLGRERTGAWEVAYENLVADLREKLSEDKIKKLAAEGVAWSEDQAVEEALKV